MAVFARESRDCTKRHNGSPRASTRPMHALVLVATLFGGGVAYRAITDVHLPVWLVLLAATLGTLALLAGERGKIGRSLCVCGVSVLLGVALSPRSQPPSSFQGALARLVVDVERSACGARGCSANVTLTACTPIEGEADACPSVGSAGFVTSEGELALDARFELLARTRPIVVFRNPTPAFTWPFQAGSFFARVAPGVSPKMLAEGRLSAPLVVARERVRKLLDASLSPAHAGVARALILGEAQAVDPELNDAIRTSGVSHVLAVSGMHVTVLAGALVWLFAALWLRTPWAVFLQARRVSALLGVGLAPLVALFAGSSPSALRAGIASSLTYAVWALGRRAHALSVAALAWIVCTVAFPRDALHPGLVLSVLATQALLTMSGDRPPWRRALLESARTWLATLPFLLVSFGTLPVVGMAANVLLAPFGTLLIPIVVAHIGVGLLASFAAPGTAWVFETASGAFLVAAQVFARLDPGFQIPPLTSVQAATLCIASWVILLSRNLKVSAGVIVVAFTLCAASEWRLRTRIDEGHIELRYLDVGQGDGALIETHDGKYMLIDAGGAPQGGPDPGERAVLPLLAALRVPALDVVVLSHPHPDHYGGLAALIDRVAIRELWDTGEACSQDTRGPACELIERMRASGTRVRGPRELCGREHQLSTVRIEVLAPCPSFDEAFSTNDNSFVLRIEHGDRRFLFMGDAEREREEQLLADLPSELRADVLKLGHHGSRSSSTERWLDAVQPWLAVVSAGRGNRFGHPHEEVSARLKAAVDHTLRTDLVGGVVVHSDGQTLHVSAHDKETSLSLTSGQARPLRSRPLARGTPSHPTTH